MFRLAASLAIALTLLACESVPDVTFSDGDTIDGGNASLDATVLFDANDTVDGAGPTGDDGAAPGADSGVDAPIAPIDAGSGTDASVVNTCPKSPPKGANACCNVVACSGQCQPNDCFKCGQCGPKMMCCPDKKFACVPLGSECPN